MKYKLVLMDEEGNCQIVMEKIEMIKKVSQEVFIAEKEHPRDVNEVFDDMRITWEQMERKRVK